MDQVKVRLPQILLGPLLDTLFNLWQYWQISSTFRVIYKCHCSFQNVSFSYVQQRSRRKLLRIGAVIKR